MALFYFSIALATVCSALYHIIQKITPAGANPALTLAVTYATSAVVSLALVLVYPLKDGLIGSLRQLNWTSVGLGLVLVGLELGFLLAYRANWNLAYAGLIANVIMALIFVPVGILAFKERITPLNVLGVLVCIGGLALVSLK
jgi:drug/metabolite transporter (DMT)-like permease